MRLAISGTHGMGKTTLVEDFVAAYPAYDHEPEPYHTLLEAGVAFAETPTEADFLEQLEHSIESLQSRSDENILFDRCPLDFVAYLQALDDAEDFDLGRYFDDIQAAIETLDAVVFLPLVAGDELADLPAEFPGLRRSVDRKLRAIIREDSLSILGSGRPRVLELRGSPERRVAMLARFLGLSV